MTRYAVLLSGILMFASVGVGTSQADKADIFGVWRVKDTALPAVTLRVTDEGGTIAGAILFYLIRREPGKEPTSSPGIPEPLLNPKIEGNTLEFKVSHRLAHPPGTLSDYPVTFRLKLVGRDRAELTRGDDSHGVEMIRDR